MNPKTYPVLFLALLFWLYAPARAAQDPENGPLMLAVHPYLPYAELIRRFSPLADYLEERVGRKVLVRVGRDYDEHERSIGNNQVDIAFMGPAAYVQMTQDYGPKPLLARLEIDGRPVFRGAVVTRVDSDIRKLGELRGRRFAFGDPLSTMSHLVPRFMLLQAGIGLEQLEDYKYLGSHNNVALGVLSGAFDAGAVKEEVFRQYQDRGLRLLAWSPPLAEHLFVARDGLPPKTMQALGAALLTLGDPQTEQGQRIMDGIKSGLTGMAPVQDSDYDNLRRIIQQVREADH